MAINPITSDFVSGQILNASSMNQLPRGVLSWTETVAQVNLSTSIATVITGATFTIPSRRLVLVSGSLGILDALSAAQVITTDIWDATSVRYSAATYLPVTNINAPPVARAFDLVAGTYTFRLRATLSTGTNRSNSTATYQGFLMAQDLGPS
jgi:hypothetical protein